MTEDQATAALEIGKATDCIIDFCNRLGMHPIIAMAGLDGARLEMTARLMAEAGFMFVAEPKRTMKDPGETEVPDGV